MANFDNIKREIDQNVNTNGVQAITGKILNTTLKDMLQEVDDKKQDTLVAGSGISISGNTISATGGGSGQEYYEGTAIDIDASNRINVVPSALPFYLAGRGLSSTMGTLAVDYDSIPSEIAGKGLQNDGNGNLEVRPSDLAGDGLIVDPNGKLAIDPTEVQEKLQAGDHISISGNTISATGFQEPLVSGQNLKTINGNSLLGSGDIVISGGSGGNYLPLEGGTLQNTSTGDTELKVIDGADEDYVKVVAPETQGERPHIEIFENGSGDTKVYYDRIEKGSDTIMLPSEAGTLALTSDLAGKQDTLTAGTGISIQGNVISATGGGSGQSYVAGAGIDISGDTISVDYNQAQEKLIAGQNINFNGRIINAKRVDAGNGISILRDTSTDIISVNASDLIGTGLTSDLNGHLNVDPNTLAGAGLRVDSNGALEVVGGGSGSGLWTSGTGSNSLLSVPAQDSTGTASGDYSLSSGFDTDATGSYSVALGYRTTAGSSYSFAAGKQPTASGTSSVALGDLASATGDYSVALGSNANASGIRSFATSNANATSTDSIALGNDATAGTGIRNTAIGTHTLATNNDEVATGKYNKNYTGGTTSENTAFTIGNGSSDSTRSNVVEVKANNDIYVVGVGGFDGTNSASATTLQDAINNGGSGSSYTAGSGIDITGGTISVDTSTIQEKLQAGNNITISGNTISATDTNTTYSAGSGLSLSGTTFSADTTVLQEKLVSGTSIKTINGTSLLGSGDITISGGNSYTAGTGISIDSNYQISVNPSDIAGAGLQDDGTGKLEVNGFLPLTGGNLRSTSSTTELNIQSRNNPDNTCVKIYAKGTGEQESYVKISAFELSEMTTKSTTFFNDRLQDNEGHKVYYPTVSSDETLAVVSDLNGKQDTLVSGTNLKTINGNSLLGSGDIQISGGNSYTAGTGISIDSNNVITNTAPDPGFWIAGSGSDSIMDRHASTANGSYSVSIGYQSQVNPSSGSFYNTAIAGGQIGTMAMYSISNATAIGNGAYCTKSNTIALGTGARAMNVGEASIGYYANSITGGTTAENTRFTVGNGTGNGSRSNLIEAKQNNDIYVVGVGGFDGTNAGTSGVETLQQAIANAGGGSGSSYWVAGSGTGSIQSTLATNALGNNAVAVGYQASASGDGSVSLRGIAYGTDSMALGGNIQAGATGALAGPTGIINNNATYSVALGHNATIETGASNSIALGEGVVARMTNEYSIGMYNKYYNSSTASEKVLFSVGNGSDATSRSNAIEVKGNNDIYVVGIGGFDGTNASSAQTLQSVVASGGSGTSYVAGNGIEINQGTISVDVPTLTSDLDALYLPLSGGNIQAGTAASSTTLGVMSPNGSASANINVEEDANTGNSSSYIELVDEVGQDSRDTIYSTTGIFANGYNLLFPHLEQNETIDTVSGGHWKYTDTDIIWGIGIGPDSTDRKNAISVASNGDIYINGLGGYTGTSINDGESPAESLQSILNGLLNP